MKFSILKIIALAASVSSPLSVSVAAQSATRGPRDPKARVQKSEAKDEDDRNADSVRNPKALREHPASRAVWTKLSRTTLDRHEKTKAFIGHETSEGFAELKTALGSETTARGVSAELARTPALKAYQDRHGYFDDGLTLERRALMTEAMEDPELSPAERATVAAARAKMGDVEGTFQRTEAAVAILAKLGVTTPRVVALKTFPNETPRGLSLKYTAAFGAFQKLTAQEEPLLARATAALSADDQEKHAGQTLEELGLAIQGELAQPDLAESRKATLHRLVSSIATFDRELVGAEAALRNLGVGNAHGALRQIETAQAPLQASR